MGIIHLVVISGVFTLSCLPGVATLAKPTAPSAHAKVSVQLLGKWNLAEQNVRDGLKAVITFKFSKGALAGSYRSLDGQVVPLENISYSQHSLSFELAAQTAPANSFVFEHHYLVQLAPASSSGVWIGVMKIKENNYQMAKVKLYR